MRVPVLPPLPEPVSVPQLVLVSARHTPVLLPARALVLLPVPVLVPMHVFVLMPLLLPVPALMVGAAAPVVIGPTKRLSVTSAALVRAFRPADALIGALPVGAVLRPAPWVQHLCFRLRML